eukprot:7333185-Pyramimonas_sp.AAC.1
MFVLVKCSSAVAVLRAPRGTIGKCVFVEFAFTIHILNAHYVPVDSVRSTVHVYIIDMLGCKKVRTYLELPMVGRGFKTEPSCGLAEVQ